MGKLKPIGSEKLEGMAKINRMIELAKYKENKPSRINEDSSNEYSIKLVDGYRYHIIKEKNGYVLKKGLNESSLEYIEPMKNRKFYSSYAQALKRLNLMTKDINLSEGLNKNVSLFTEGEEGEKKYYLSMKRSTNEQPLPPEQKPQTPAPEPAPAPAPAAAAPAPAPAPSPEPSPEAGMEEPLPDETMDVPSEDDMEQPEDKTETVTFKTVQKLTGRLGQKLRALNADEENKMSSKDIKYVINSILSALDLNDLDDDDREQIMNKFEGEEGMEGSEEDMTQPEDDMSDEEMGMEQSPEEVTPETPQPPSDEVAEDYDSIDEDDMFDDDMFSDDEEPHFGMGKYESDMMENMIEGIFSESKVDKVLRNYFKLDKKEKTLLENKKSLNNKINNYSVSVSQKVASKKFINENKNIKWVGVTNHGSLVFEKNGKQVKVTDKGRIL